MSAAFRIRLQPSQVARAPGVTHPGVPSVFRKIPDYQMLLELGMDADAWSELRLRDRGASARAVHALHLVWRVGLMHRKSLFHFLVEYGSSDDVKRVLAQTRTPERVAVIQDALLLRALETEDFKLLFDPCAEDWFGCRPSDYARMRGDHGLSAVLKRVENSYGLERHGRPTIRQMAITPTHLDGLSANELAACKHAFRYYAAIDAADAAGSERERLSRLRTVIDMFTPQALYARNEEDLYYSVVESLPEFFTKIRDNCGKHRDVMAIFAKEWDSKVYVLFRGQFAGHMRSTKAPVTSNFLDHLVYDIRAERFSTRMSDIDERI